MIRKLSNRNGSTMVLVIMIVAVLSILVVSLMEASVQNFNICRANGHMDYSYYAGESALQKCFDALERKCGDESLAGSSAVHYTGNVDAFAQSILNLVISPYIKTLNDAGAFKDIDVAEDPANKADVGIKLRYMGSRYDPVKDPGKIFIKIGAEADSSYVVKPYSTGNKKVFAQKEFAVKLPKKFELKGPLYTIGDFMAGNHSAVNITGDVYVYGTSPEIMSQPEQYYYGGICAQNSSVMNIYGNAYTRSFIRTGDYRAGEYSPVPEDNSRIYVFKDAIAQGIQIFGKKDRIGVYRNAYTFDDLEVNGEDSVLAVNGSFFGLSSGSDAVHHDGSSAIVSSATVHFANSSESQRSRIVVNGAVMINGSTFRIDPVTGKTLYAIEDASLAWYDGGPLYKWCPIDLTGPYKDWLKDGFYDTSSKGFANLLQVWNVMPWFSLNSDEAKITAKSNINLWFSRIDTARESGESNDWSSFDFAAAPSKIEGFCHYEMAANDSLYFMDKDSDSQSQIKKAALLTDNFILDNVTPPEVEGGWKSFWNSYVGADHGWGGGYCLNVPGVLETMIKPGLLALTQPFISRESRKDGPLYYIEHTSGQTFNKLHSMLGDLADYSGNQFVIRVREDETGGVSDPGNLSDPGYPFNNLADNPWAKDMLFLVVNSDPDRTLEINGTTFNGVIFTMGKVILKGNATVNGAVIAAGRGFDEDPGKNYTNGSAADTVIINDRTYANRAPRIKKTEDGVLNLNVLNSGGYAAVYIDSGEAGAEAGIHFPHPDPEVGRQILLDQFKDQGLDLSIIF